MVLNNVRKKKIYNSRWKDKKVRENDRQTGRQTDRKTDRERERER